MVGGDSAGGNMAAVVAIAARDGLAPKLAGQVLIYPSTDFSRSHASHKDPTTSILLTHSVITWFMENYMGGADMNDWRCSPARGEIAGRAGAGLRAHRRRRSPLRRRRSNMPRG